MPKNICISGANRGIGLGLTRQFLQAGHQVWALVRQPSKATELSSLSRDFKDRLKILQADVASEKELEQIAQSLKDQPLDLLINNAGVMLDPQVPFTELSLDIFKKTFDTNVWGAIALTQKLIPSLKQGKNPIVAMISSQMGSLAENKSGGYYAYRSSKAALNMVVKTLAQEYSWLTPVTLHPGWVQTDMGGKQATTTIDESTTGLVKVLSEMKHEQSGTFLDYKGKTLPW